MKRLRRVWVSVNDYREYLVVGLDRRRERECWSRGRDWDWNGCWQEMQGWSRCLRWCRDRHQRWSLNQGGLPVFLIRLCWSWIVRVVRWSRCRVLMGGRCDLSRVSVWPDLQVCPPAAREEKEYY